MSKKHYLSNEDISILCSELASVVSSGLTITDGILVILQDDEDKRKAALLEKILGSVEQGSSITKAFAKTGAFPNYFLKMLEVGETTGRLDTVFASLSEYYAGIEEISISVKSAVTYPAILLIVVFAVIILLSVYVLPIFADVFAQLGRLTLPESAQWIMNTGGVISNVAVFIIGTLAFIIILGVLLYNLVRPFRKAVIHAVSHTKTAKTLYAARFSAALSMTLSSGMDIDESLDMCENLLENDYMREKLTECRKKMTDGKAFVEALSETGIFSAVNMRMISIAFSTGTLDKTMATIADNAEKKVSAVIQNAVARFEPTMVIIMAVAVGFILLSVMIPLMGVMTVIG